MTATDVREVRAIMLSAADGLCQAAGETSQTRLSIPMAYAEGVLRTLAATILPPDEPDPVRAPAVEQANGGRARASTAARDRHGRFLPAGAS